MSDFFDSKTKKNLTDAKSRIQAITTVYNMDLSKLSQSELIYADVVNKYRQLLISNAVDKINANSGKEDSMEACKKIANKEILKYIKERYGIDNIPLENVDVAIEGAAQRASRVFETIDRYKKAIHDAYLSYDTKLRHCSSSGNIKALNSTVRENQYLNEIVNGVFASSDYNDIVNYMGRAITGGMICRDGIVVYPENPYSLDTSTKSKLSLKTPMFLYTVDAQDFDPSVCLELQHGTREDGSSIFFADLRFDGEWTCKKSQVECEREEITTIPTSHLKEYQILYRKGKVDLDYSQKNREEYKKMVKKMIGKDKLGYVNEEMGINASLLPVER